ncbi:hypothetical protein Tco_1103229 [Tanacetum coccineum]
MAFPRLQELAAAQNSNNLTNAMSIYIERKINDDLHFAARLSHLWEVLYSRVNEHRLLIAELNVFDDDFDSSELTIYEMMIGCFVWKVRYRVHIDDFMTPLPEGWSIRSNIWSIALGERKQDSFLVIKLSRKVVQYNLISKTLHEIYDCGSNQLDDNHDDNDDDKLLQQFQAEHNVYEFIPSFASM